MKDDLKAIRKLLTILVVPFILYLLNLLSFIFVPFAFALFGSLIFMPMMRWFQRRNIHNIIALAAVIICVVIFFIAGYQVIQLSAMEISSANQDFYTKFDDKINTLINPVLDMMGIVPLEGESNVQALINNEKISASLFGNMGNTLNFTQQFVSMLLMTIFFLVLLLSGSMNIQKVMESLIFKQKHASVKMFRRIEKDIQKFIWVKFLMSFFTGLGFGLACYFFDVSFPFFWGFFAFAINFVQMVGSIISIVVLSAFSLVEIDHTGTLLFFILVITGVQVLFGGILEPIFMGKSFQINTITVLIMLALWGFIWGIPGLILSIPITALVKKILEQFPHTKVYADIMS